MCYNSVSSGKTIIFLHIPKAAGITFLRILHRVFPPDRLFISIHDRWDEFRALSHREKKRYRVFHGHIGFGLHEELRSPCTYITMLRDPLDIVLSEYYFVLRKPSHRLHSLFSSPAKTLNDFITFRYEELGLTDVQTRMISGYFGSPYGSSFSPLPPDALDKAKQNLQKYFGVAGIVERFDESLLLMKKAFGWKNVLYARKNVTHNRPGTHEIDDAIKARILEHSALDGQLYDFANELMEDQIHRYGDSFELDLRAFRQVNQVYTLAHGAYAMWPEWLKKRIRSRLDPRRS